AVGGVWGLATGGCTVMGCGAPVLPVIGLAFVGLSSTTIKWMSDLSSIGTTAALLGLSAAVLWMGWRVERPAVMPTFTREVMRVGISLTSSHTVADPREGARWVVERTAAAPRAGPRPLLLGRPPPTP